MGELGALFNPGMRHEIEERQSKANRREEEGNARDGDLRIDLASGVAVINVHGKSGAAAADSEAESTPKPRAKRTTRMAPRTSASQKSTQQKSTQQKPTQQKPTAASGRGRDAGAAVEGDGETGSPRTPQPSSKASRAAR